MDTQDLAVSFDHIEPDMLMESWVWLIGANKLPALITALGDVFLQDIDDGKMYFLKASSAELSEIAASMDEFVDLLSDESFVQDYFSVLLVEQLKAIYEVLPDGCVYRFNKQPSEGGCVSEENVALIDVDAYLLIQGKIQQALCQE